MLLSWSLSNHKNNKIINVSYALLYVSYILIVRFHMDCVTGCELDSIRRSPDCRLASCGLTGGLLSQNCWTWHINRSFSSSQYYHFQNKAKSKTVLQKSDGSQVNDRTKMVSWPDRWHISVKLNMMKKISTWSWWTLRWSTWPPLKRINWNASKPFLWK